MELQAHRLLCSKQVPLLTYRSLGGVHVATVYGKRALVVLRDIGWCGGNHAQDRTVHGNPCTSLVYRWERVETKTAGGVDYVWQLATSIT